jgi:hypothetical protein
MNSPFRFARGTHLIPLVVSACWLTEPSLVYAQVGPSIVSTVPTSGATGVLPDAPVVFTFSAAMNTSLTSAQFVDASGFPPTVLPSTPSWGADLKQLNCTPNPAFPANKMVVWVVIGEDQSGNALQGTTAGFFTTGSSGGPGTGTNMVAGLVSRGELAEQVDTDLLQTTALEIVALAGVNPTNSVALTAPPPGVTNTLQDAGVPGVLEFGDTEGDALAFATNYPAGNYQFTLATLAGTSTAVLNLPDGALPPAPRVANWHNPPYCVLGQPWLVQWDFASGGAAVDYVRLRVEQSGAVIFATPLAEVAGALTGMSNVAGAHLLWQAARLTLREGVTPLRSLGRVSIRPRTYQFVPLLMALRLDPIRMLIADDVGVGKTIEGLLITRELFDRGEIKRLCVLCPPYLCEQWQKELNEKFNLDAVLIRSRTVNQLERRIPAGGGSIFSYYPVQVVSIDFVKGDRKRANFLQHCPDFVIVDEAHGAASAAPTNASQLCPAQRKGRPPGAAWSHFHLLRCLNSHDQYFFHRRADMVAGSVRPPRLDVANESLVQAHLHAVWLAQVRLPLGDSIEQVIDTDDEAQLPLRATAIDAIQLSEAARNEVRARVRRILQFDLAALANAGWFSDAWLEAVIAEAPVNFNRAFDRWRELFRAAAISRGHFRVASPCHHFGVNKPCAQQVRSSLGSAYVSGDAKM